MLAGAWLLSFALLVSAWAGGSQPATTGVEVLLDGVRCEPAVRRQLAAWDARLAEAAFEPPLPTGTRTALVPTPVLGLWVRIIEEAAAQVAIERITATRIERLRFDQECAVSELAVATSPPPDGAFGDSDLIARIARGDRGVVLLWSPHMPLSVDQHAVLTRVAEDLGLAVIALLDPAADPDYAARVAREGRLAPEATRPLGGVELAFRGMTTHTPSLQAFANGRLVGPVLYGYRSDGLLRAALGAALGNRR
jgi:hypothetical protein